MISRSVISLGDQILNWQRSPHLLLSGVTGSSKSSALLLASLSSMSPKSSLGEQRGMSAKAYFADGKGALGSVLNKKIAVTPAQLAKLLRIMVENMKARYEHFSNSFGKDATDQIDEFGRSVRPIIIAIDELGIFLNDSKTRGEILRYLFQLLVGARQASIYVTPQMGHK